MHSLTDEQLRGATKLRQLEMGSESQLQQLQREALERETASASQHIVMASHSFLLQGFQAWSLFRQFQGSQEKILRPQGATPPLQAHEETPAPVCAVQRPHANGMIPCQAH
jgi:hypothetical protein